MKRRTFLGSAAASLWGQSAARPNVVLILADDLGSADVGCFGAKDIRTPHIDSLAKAGVRFTQAYCNAPECTPSRTALLTGRYQQRVGGMECAIGVGNVGRYDEAVWLAERGQLGLPKEEVTIATLLKKAGYETACFGKWHLGYGAEHGANRHGFDEYFGVLGGNADYYKHTEEDGAKVLSENGRVVEREGYVTDLIGERAVEWLMKRGRRPFFLYVPFTAPHAPYQSPRVKAIEGGWNKGTRAVYGEMVEAMDRQVGAILGALEKTGKAGETWVIFLSDNGGTGVGSNAPLRGMKSSVWEGGIRTPMVMRWPGVFGAGTETAQVTVMFDVTAAIAGACGAKVERAMDGKDLRAVWKGEKGVEARTLYWRYRRGEITRKAVRDGDWKLVWDNGKEELHDLGKDPMEQEDLKEREAGKAAELRKKLEGWEREVRAGRLKEFYRGQPG